MSNEVKFIVSAETRQAAAALTTFLNGLQSGLARVAGPLAALTSVGGFSLLAKQAIDAADVMGKAARLAGATAKEFTGMAYAAQRDEVDLATLRTGLKELSKYLGETGQGSKNLKEALLEQSDAFAKLPDGIEKNRLALEIFPRSGVRMIEFLSQGSAGMAEMFERGERLTGMNEDLARSADEFNDALSDLHVASQGLAGSLVSGLLPGLTRLLLAVTEGIVKFREWTKESIAFEAAVRSVGIALGALTIYKFGGLAASGLGALLGVGSIKSLRDFIAALQLAPAAAAAAAGGMATFAASIVAVTAAITTALYWWEMWSSIAGEQTEIYKTAQANEELAVTLRKRIEADKEAGRISEEEYQALRKRIIDARALADGLDVGIALSAIGQDLTPAGDAGDRWSKDRFDLQQKALAVQLARRDLELARNQLAFDRTRLGTSRAQSQLPWEMTPVKDGEPIEISAEFLSKIQLLQQNLETLNKQEEILTNNIIDAMQAKEQGAIKQADYDQLELETQQKILAIEAQRVATKTQIIDSDWRKTDADKFRQKKEQGLPVDGPDVDSIGENVEANLTRLLNSFKSFSQAAADLISNGIGNAIQGVSDGIMGMIDGTKSWADVWRGYLRQMLAEFIDFTVKQTAAFVMGENGKNVAAAAGFVKRAAIWVGETLFHGAQVVMRVGAHIAGEVAMTVASVAQAAIRMAVSLKEAIVWVIKAAVKAASSVADIPYVGWALAIAALAGVTAAGVAAVNGAREEGGPVEASNRYTFNERGQEIFVPAQRGRVLSHRDSMLAVQNAGGKPSAGDAAQVSVANFIVADLNELVYRAMEQPRGTKIMAQTIDGKRLDLGFNT